MPGRTAPRAQRPPNLLMLFADEHNARFAGYMGSKLARTPNLDRLAAEGVAFDNAVCNSPLCSTSRQSFMSGLHCHRIGMWDNCAAMPEDTVTWAHLLSAAGYETSLFGKMHFNGYQKLYGFDRRPVLEGNDAGDEFHSWGVRRCVDWTAVLDHPRVPHRGMWDQLVEAGADGAQRQPLFRHDFKIFDGAIAFLRGKGEAKDPGPWAACVSFALPHPPWKARPDLLERFRGVGDLPFNHRGDGRDDCDRSLHGYTGWLMDLPAERIRNAREVYLALIAEADEHIGRVLAALAEAGLERDTVVFSFADHGEMAGEHGLWGKVSLLESSLRVPLIARWPGRFPAGRRVAAPVSLVDLFPTFLELAGAELPAPLAVDGTSLVPLLAGGAGGAGRTTLSEMEGEGWNHPRACVRDARYKLVCNHGAGTRLYDLVADPFETRDLCGDSAHAAGEDRLRRRLFAEWDGESIERAVLSSQARRGIARCRNVARDMGW